MRRVTNFLNSKVPSFSNLSSFLLGMALPLLLAISLLALSPSVLWAEGKCRVSVKVVKAAGGQAKLGAGVSRSLAPQPREVSSQLASLQFSDFGVIDSASNSVEMAQAARFSLRGAQGGQHQLSVVPQAKMGNKLHVVVDWSGPRNDKLLSTKLRLLNGVSMVLGADGSQGVSTILCVNVLCG